MIALLLLACTDKVGPADSEALPDCASPVTLPFDPVLQSQTRFDTSSAAWTGDVDVSAGSPASFAGTGQSTSRLHLNRGQTYQMALTLEGDATLELVQTLESGGTELIGSWSAGTTQTSFTVASNGVQFDFVLSSAGGEGTITLTVTGDAWAPDPEAVSSGPLLFGYFMHIEEAPRFLTDEANWVRRARVVEGLSAVLAAHGGGLTFQPGSTFIEGAAIWEPNWVADRLAEGMTWSVHLHNESEGEVALEKAARTALNDYEAAGLTVTDLNGGFGTGIWERMAAAGLRGLSAFKSPVTQLDLARPAVSPWRVAEGTTSEDEVAFSTHDPDGPLIYVPGSGVREAERLLFADFLQSHLDQVRTHSRAGFVNTYYVMDHVDAFGPDVDDDTFDTYLESGLSADLALVDAALTQIVDPLVVSGDVVYSNPVEMRRAFEDWESRCVIRE